MNTIERWVVEEWNSDYEEWFPWGQHGHTNQFWSYHNARKGYEEYKKDFHYSPRWYRYCKIEIQPETIINKQVHSTINELDEEINLTQKAESQIMKFT